MNNINGMKNSARILAISVVAAFVLMGTAMADITRTGLVAELHFDGDARDSSGYGNDGVIYGANFVDGKFRKAFVFNGISDYVEIPDKSTLDFTNSFSLGAWIRTSASSYQMILEKNDFSLVPNFSDMRNFGMYLKPDGTLNFFGKCDTPQDFGETMPLNDGNWHYVFAVRDSAANMRNIYVDGNLKNSSTDTQCDDFSNPQAPLSIGIRLVDFKNMYFNGIIDEVSIYNRALSAEEVKANYEAGQIIITSSPSGAEVLINNKWKGVANPTLIVSGVSPSSYAAKCKLSGYSDYDTNVILPPSSVASVNCALNPAPTITTPTPAITTPVQTTLTPSNPEAQPGTPPSTSSATPPIAVKSASITGKITDEKTGEPAKDVTVNIEGKSATTDANGEYDLTVEVGKHSLSVSKEGYETITRSVLVQEGGTMLDLSIKSASGDSTWLWISVFLIIIIIAACIIYLVFKKKKQKTEAEKKNATETKEKKAESKVEKKKFCMFCHAPIVSDAEFCSKCGKKQDETKRFCMSCGALMPSVPELCGKCKMNPPSGDDTKNCRNCGEVIPVVAKFCSACGAGQPE